MIPGCKNVGNNCVRRITSSPRLAYNLSNPYFQQLFLILNICWEVQNSDVLNALCLLSWLDCSSYQRPWFKSHVLLLLFLVFLTSKSVLSMTFSRFNQTILWSITLMNTCNICNIHLLGQCVFLNFLLVSNTRINFHVQYIDQVAPRGTS